MKKINQSVEFFTVPPHGSTFVLDIAEKLNICFVALPKYAPWINCVKKSGI